MGGPVRLDLGAGHKREEGWIRVDLEVSRHKVNMKGEVLAHESPLEPDIVGDLRAIPLPDDFADEARAIHVIEHFYPWDAGKVLKEWVRVLKPGASIAVECPCLDKIIKLFEVPNVPPYLTYWGLYGDPRLEDEYMMHRWCYTEIQLAKLMTKAGLTDLRPEPPQYHQPVRDMRIVGAKAVERRIIT